ncbi:MAG TPA: response regulator transcription factor [Terriglobales bacterium]
MAPSSKVRLAIATPYEISRQALAALISQTPGFYVVASGGYGTDLVEGVVRSKPDVLLIERNGSGSNWLSGLRKVGQLGIPVKALLISEAGTEDAVLEGFEFGLRGVVPKDAPAETLFKSIRCVSAGEYWLGRDRIAGVMDYLRRAKVDTHTNPETHLGLTARERDVIRALLTGASNKEIAQSLAISNQAVRHHLCSIFHKVGVANRLELVLFVMENRLFEGATQEAM